MRRKITAIISIAVIYLLQTAVLREIVPTGTVPNLILAFVVIAGFLRGRRAGLWIGFVIGLITDLFSGGVFGFHALVYMLIGYADGMGHQVFFDHDYKIPMLMTAVSDFFYQIMFFLFHAASVIPFGEYLKTTLVPELLLTVMAVLVCYPVFRRIEKGLRKYDLEDQSIL